MKFYQSVKLHEDHYHLQLILWNETMDPDEEPTEYVITRLTFGLKSSSQQLEHGHIVTFFVDEFAKIRQTH